MGAEVEEVEMSLGGGSPSPSSGSDDFAALLDAEMLGDRSSSTPERSGGEGFTVEEAGGVESSAGEEEEEEGVEEEDEEEEDEEEEEDDDGIEEDGIEQENPIETDDDLQLQELSRKRRRGEDDEPAGASGVAAIEMCPPHPGFMWGVCIRCGEKRSTIPTNDPIKASVALRYIHEGLEVSTEEAHRMRCDELRRVTLKQKLLLVVDLDHTMLNSARFLEVPQEEEAYLAAAYLGPNAATVGELQGGTSSLHQLTRLQMWTKLRPYAHGFLEEASKLYEMYVYTMGEKIYALAMARLLDPTGRLFGDRIISQLDSTKRNTKDLDVVLGAESAVVILDDTEMVWPNHKANLILMERYHFFSSSSRQFAVGSPSLAQMHRDESGSDGTLATTLKVLRAIHHGYFHKPLDQKLKRRPLSDVSNVQEVIRKIRAKVLAGCNIVFSRIFPVGHPSPEYHPFWQLAVSLGAKCSTSYDTITTTHVVALDRGTDKARTAKLEGKFLVHPSWVEAARYLWCRPHEKDYPVTDDTSKSPVTMFVKSVPIEPQQQADVAGGNGESQTQEEQEQSAAEVDILKMNTSEIEIAVMGISSQAVHVNGSKADGVQKT